MADFVIEPAPDARPGSRGGRDRLPWDAAARKRLLTRVGVWASVAMFTLLAGFHAVTLPMFMPPDEAAHVGYALEVSHGRLPTIATRIPSQGVPGMAAALKMRDRAHRGIWTANHPPLFYVLAALPVRLGLATAPSENGLKLARLLPVAFGALGVWLIALLAAQLVPGRPAIQVGAAAVAATVPAFTHYSGILYNDSLGFATSTATLLMAVIVLRRGPSGRTLGLLVAAAAAAALTRSSGLAVAGVATLAVLIGTLRRGTAIRLPDRLAAPAMRGVVAAGLAALVPLGVALTSGWFWLRNLRLYGDVTGTSVLLDQFHREPAGSVLNVLTDPEYWSLQAQRFLDFSFYRFTEYSLTASSTSWARLLVLVPAAGVAAIVIRRVRHRLAPNWRRPGDRLLAWVLALGLLGLLEVAAAEFAGAGGSIHGRYLLPGLGVLAIGTALGLGALPGGRHGAGVVVLVVGLLGVNMVALNQYLFWDAGAPLGQTGIGAALERSGLPFLASVAALGLGLALLTAVIGIVLWNLAPAPSPFPVLPPGVRRLLRPRREAVLPVRP
jgi:hypothetical protein